MSKKKAQKKNSKKEKTTNGRIPDDMRSILVESAYSIKAYKDIMKEAEKSIALYIQRQEKVLIEMAEKLNIPKEVLHMDAGLGIWKDTRKND